MCSVQSCGRDKLERGHALSEAWDVMKAVRVPCVCAKYGVGTEW
jgi:hypothetical protein